MDTHNRESTEGDEATLGPRAWARLKIYHTLLESEDILLPEVEVGGVQDVQKIKDIYLDFGAWAHIYSAVNNVCCFIFVWG